MVWFKYMFLRLLFPFPSHPQATLTTTPSRPTSHGTFSVFIPQPVFLSSIHRQADGPYSRPKINHCGPTVILLRCSQKPLYNYTNEQVSKTDVSSFEATPSPIEWTLSDVVIRLISDIQLYFKIKVQAYTIKRLILQPFCHNTLLPSSESSVLMASVNSV